MINTSSKIAFVTVLFNCEKHLALFFECLAAQIDRDFVLVIIDNASKDASLARSRQLAALHQVPCEFIANGDNLGIAVGNNQGIEWARHGGLQHIVLINNDISCDADLVAQIRHRAIGGGHRAWTCLAYLGDSQTRWYGGGRLSFWRARGMHYGQRQSLGVVAPRAVTYAPTCLMYLHSSVFDVVGMMDPQYFVYYDDTDFCKRMLEAGIPLRYDPLVSFRHYVGGSSGGEFSEFSLRINTRNKFIYIRRHYRGIIYWIVLVGAILSKAGQLISRNRRRPTLLGLGDAYRILPQVEAKS